MLTRISMLLLLVAVLVQNVSAQDSDRLNGRTRLDLRIGLGVITERSADVFASAGAGSVDFGLDTARVAEGGIFLAMAFTKWLQEEWAVLVAVKVLWLRPVDWFDPTAYHTDQLEYYVKITQVELGMRHYLSGKQPMSTVRPFLAAAAGPVTATRPETSVDGSVVIRSRQETAIGMHLAAGLDIIASREVIFGVEIGYNLVTDFSDDLALRRNYSGLDFMVSFGLLFGSAKDPG